MNDSKKEAAQKNHLMEAIEHYRKYLGYASHNSRFAVPGQADDVLEELECVYVDHYGENP